MLSTNDENLLRIEQLTSELYEIPELEHQKKSASVRWKRLYEQWNNSGYFIIVKALRYMFRINVAPTQNVTPEIALESAIAVELLNDPLLRKHLSIGVEKIENCLWISDEYSPRLFKKFIYALAKCILENWNRSFLESIIDTSPYDAISKCTSSSDAVVAVQMYQKAIVILIPEAANWSLREWLRWKNYEIVLRKSYGTKSNDRYLEDDYLIEYVIKNMQGNPNSKDYSGQFPTLFTPKLSKYGDKLGNKCGIYVRKFPIGLADRLWPNNPLDGIYRAFKGTRDNFASDQVPWIPSGKMRFEETGIYKALSPRIEGNPLDANDDAIKKAVKNAYFDYKTGA